jgi:hypothetical protein
VEAEGAEIFAQGAEGGRGVLDEDDVGRAATEGLDADGSGAGEEIGEDSVSDARSEDIEESLAEAVRGGAGGVPAGSDELAGAEFAGDYAHVR